MNLLIVSEHDCWQVEAACVLSFSVMTVRLLCIDFQTAELRKSLC